MNDKQLPEGWTSAPLKELATSVKGKKPRTLSPEPSEELVPYIDIAAFERDEWRQWADVKSARIVDESQILVVWDGARSGLVGMGRAGALGSTLAALSAEAVETAYLFRFLQSQFDHINSNPRGTGIPHVDPEVFWEIEVPLAPLPEQRRIVAKLDELMNRLDAVRAKLERVPGLLAHFRRAVLSAACSGALTRDWREENDAGEDDWTETTLGELSQLVTSGSRGWAQYYSESGAIFIRAQDINKDWLNLENVAHVNPPKGSEGARTKVKADDLLITVTGANVAKSAIVDIDLDEAYVSQHVGLVRLKQPEIARYVFICLISPSFGREHLLDAAYGAGKPGLNLDNIKQTPVPLPPLAEQLEIVARVNALWALADSLEARFDKAQAFFDRLPGALLAKAFRGELVPQAPDDESAETLLQQLRAAREQPTKAAKPARRARAKSRAKTQAELELKLEF